MSKRPGRAGGRRSPVSGSFRDFVVEQLEQAAADIRAKPMFGAVGIYSGEHFFAVIDSDRLYFKVDDQTRPKFEAAGMRPAEIVADGKVVTLSYWEVPLGALEAVDELRSWVKDALDVAKRAARRPARLSRQPPRREDDVTTGYSGRPLAKKLGLADGCEVAALGAPAHYKMLLGPLPKVRFVERAGIETDIVHLFTTKRSELAARLSALRKTIKPDAAVWVSWPKKASKVTTDITEDTIRDIALPMGFVDIKVCAVDDIWSGLKLVIRKQLRPR